MTLPMLFVAPLLALVGCAAFTDIKSRRIPNWLTGAGLLVALGLHTALSGWSGLGFSAFGMCIGFAIYLGLYLMRALGAGDVKLMAAVGAFAGAALWMQIFLITAVIGGIAALVFAVVKGKLRTTLWNAGFIAAELLHFRAPYVRDQSLDVQSPGSLTLPHGVAIAGGVAFCVSAPGCFLLRDALLYSVR